MGLASLELEKEGRRLKSRIGKGGGKKLGKVLSVIDLEAIVVF